VSVATTGAQALDLVGKQVYDVMVERCGASQNSGPK